MSVEQNKAVARQYVEQVWNAHRHDLLDKFYAEDFKIHGATGATDRESTKMVITRTQQAFPDIQVSIEAEIAEGDLVSQRQTISATHKGEFNGLPATGKHVTFTGMSIFRIQDGKIAEVWTLSDGLSMMQQLGVIPAPQAPAD